MSEVKGIIKNWDVKKGFGFVTSVQGNRDVFVHKTAFPKYSQDPQVGDQILYAMENDADGRPAAKSATFINPKKSIQPKRKPTKKLTFSIVLSLSTLSGLLLGWLFGHVHTVLLVYVSLVSLVTFLIYARDKAKAQNDGWRTSERTLHLFGLVGGWPGAAFAQHLLRHKSSKSSFRRIYGITIVLNLAILIWLSSPQGQVFAAPYFAQIERSAVQLYGIVTPILISLWDMILQQMNSVLE
jgi:uncharacterized membrane protein YsdA (DUF1294 family)/cold shock CspA family protein